MICPECGSNLTVENITINGEPVREIHCSNPKCNYMRLE